MMAAVDKIRGSLCLASNHQAIFHLTRAETIFSTGPPRLGQSKKLEMFEL
jgi:hypothetical protein